MIPALNPILFFLSTFFGLQTVFVAEQINLILDFESKTGTIEYINLKTPIEAIEFAQQGLNKIDQSTTFNNYFTQVKLISKKIEKKDNGLNVLLNFSFDNKDELLKLLRFNVTQIGEKTPSDSIYYHLLPSEGLINSNGNDGNTGENISLKWGKELKSIKLQLKQNSKPPIGETVSILNYWKK